MVQYSDSWCQVEAKNRVEKRRLLAKLLLFMTSFTVNPMEQALHCHLKLKKIMDFTTPFPLIPTKLTVNHPKQNLFLLDDNTSLITVPYVERNSCKKRETRPPMLDASLEK